MKKTLLLLPILLLPMGIFPQSRTHRIFAFRNFTKPNPIRMILVGEIRSKIKVARPQERDTPYVGYDTRLDKVTVKVLNRKGIKVGQKLYIIDKNPFHKQYRNGLIVGEIRVRSIQNNPFYGWSLTGTGILLRVREGMFVARTLDSENLERAFAFKKKGDHFYNRGDLEKAITEYYKALEADRALPEAHSALGKVYQSMARRGRGNLPVRALAEFDLAWRNRENFQYASDEYRFYLNYLDVLHFAFNVQRHGDTSPGALDRKYLSPALRVARKGLQLKMGDRDLLRFLCRTQYFRMKLKERQMGGAPAELQQETAGLLKKLLQSTPVDSVTHEVAFLFYHDLYYNPGFKSNFEKMRNLIYFSDDFDQRAGARGRERGRAGLRKLILFHGEQYQKYSRAAGRWENKSLTVLYQNLLRNAE